MSIYAWHVFMDTTYTSKYERLILFTKIYNRKQIYRTLRTYRAAIIMLFTGLFLLAAVGSYGQTTIWIEDFEDEALNAFSGNGNPKFSPVGFYDWSTTDSDFKVVNNAGDKQLQGSGTDVTGSAWEFNYNLDISTYINVKISMNYGEQGSLETNDSIVIAYSLNAGTWEKTKVIDDFTSAVYSETSLNGNTLNLKTTIYPGDNGESYWIDDIKIEGTLAGCVEPDITCPANITIDASEGRCDTVVNFLATSTGTSPVIDYYLHYDTPAATEIVSGHRFQVGVYTVTAVASNAC